MTTHNQYDLYCRFSRDVTKIQTTKVLILLIFYFYDEYEQLKTNIHTTVLALDKVLF